MTMTVNPTQREKKVWIKLDKNCVVEGKNRRIGDEIQLRNADAAYLINFKKAHRITQQPQQRGPGRPKSAA